MTSCGCTSPDARPTDILKAEHRVIERVLTALERFAACDAVDAGAFYTAIDFLRNFADGCHHAKEEHELFPRLEAAGIPRENGPIGCMLDDHTRGRSLVQQMAESVAAAARGDGAARAALRAAVREYVALLRQHIWKEDHVLFELADRALSGCAQRALVDGFERTEQSDANLGKHARYLRLADELYERATQPGAPAAEGATR